MELNQESYNAINLVILLILVLIQVLTFAFACWVYNNRKQKDDEQDLFLKDLDNSRKLNN